MPQMFPDTVLARLSDLLATHMGLHFPTERWADLERGVVATATDLGSSDALSWARQLLAARVTPREIDALASRLTIGETYFLRDRHGTAAFTTHILPELLRTRGQAERRLRIWSAGCCTGEEPYSIAMLLDGLIPDAAAWDITLLGTDLNTGFLCKAMRGEYGEWSLRGVPQWIRERYFKRGQNGGFALDERIRGRVQFSRLNLADDAYPSLTSNTTAMDVIFCRNVLMYFTAERVRRVLENFHRALVDGGWLIVGPAETSMSEFARFTAVEIDGAILYRKSGHPEARRGTVAVPVPDAGPGQETFRAPRQPWSSRDTPSDESNRPAAAQPAGPAIDHAEGMRAIGAARDCANLGRLEEATEWCRAAITADRLNAAHQYLLAMIQQEHGLVDAAAESYARTLYLDPDFVLAHFALGNLCRSQGRYRQARRHLDNALSLLRAHSPDDVLPESEGLRAGQFCAIIETLRSSLPERATDA